MKEENLIHVKFEYNEALNSKKNVLSLEMNLIKIMKKIRQYHFLRLKELKTKTKLHSKIRGTKTNIKNIQISLPKIKIPELLKKGKPIEKHEEIIKKEKVYDKDLESELKDIQRRLKQIEHS